MSDETHPHIDAYLDGQLAPDDAARAATHVAGCPACQKEVAEARLLEDALAQPVVAVAAGFAPSTRERALGRRMPETPLWWLTLPAPLRAGLAALLLLAALAGVRIGNAMAGSRSEAAQLAAALDTPAADAMVAAAGAEVRR